MKLSSQLDTTTMLSQRSDQNHLLTSASPIQFVYPMFFHNDLVLVFMIKPPVSKETPFPIKKNFFFAFFFLNLNSLKMGCLLSSAP